MFLSVSIISNYSLYLCLQNYFTCLDYASGINFCACWVIIYESLGHQMLREQGWLLAGREVIRQQWTFVWKLHILKKAMTVLLIGMYDTGCYQGNSILETSKLTRWNDSRRQIFAPLRKAWESMKYPIREKLYVPHTKRSRSATMRLLLEVVYRVCSITTFMEPSGRWTTGYKKGQGCDKVVFADDLIIIVRD